MPILAAQKLRIIVVAPQSLNPDHADKHAANEAVRSRELRIGLLESGYNLIAVLPADGFVEQRIAQLPPDMIIVDSISDARRPIVLFTEDNDTSHVKDAVAAGVNAYIVGGLTPERICPILDVAIARFELQERKTIDRAKGMLMQRQNLTKQQAYDKLRKTAMDKGLKLADVAQRMLDVADLLG